MDTNREIWPRTYVPAPHKPKWVDKDLRRIGGINAFGENNYRLEWGMDLRTFQAGNPSAIKYLNPNNSDIGWACWMLERYAAPAFFNRTVWNASRFAKDVTGTDRNIDYLGPFPDRGDYILIMPMTTDNYEFIELSSQLIVEIGIRVAEGSQKDDVIGLLEIKRRKKAAKDAQEVRKQLDAQREYYETRGVNINTVHTREYIGLNAPLLPPPNQAMAQQFLQAVEKQQTA